MDHPLCRLMIAPGIRRLFAAVLRQARNPAGRIAPAIQIAVLDVRRMPQVGRWGHPFFVRCKGQLLHIAARRVNKLTVCSTDGKINFFFPSVYAMNAYRQIPGVGFFRPRRQSCRQRSVVKQRTNRALRRVVPPVLDAHLFPVRNVKGEPKVRCPRNPVLANGLVAHMAGSVGCINTRCAAVRLFHILFFSILHTTRRRHGAPLPYRAAEYPALCSAAPRACSARQSGTRAPGRPDWSVRRE